MSTMTEAGDWRAAANARIEKHRKSDFAIRLLDGQGQPLTNGPVAVRQTRSAFGLGTCIGGDPTSQQPFEQRYWQFVREHFNTVVCENDMKWYVIGKNPGPMNFAPADRLLKFAQDNQLAMRGHCLFWSKKKFVQGWVQNLAAPELRQAAFAHLEATVSRYKGQLIAWDVYNEMLDGSFYESQLGGTIAIQFFKKAHAIDPDVPLFVNEYNIIDSDERTEKYVEMIRRLQKSGAPIGGIGIQEHASERLSGQLARPDPAHPERAHMGPLSPEGMLRRLNRLAELNLPIHLTEISSCTLDEQQRAEGIDALFRIGYSHPRVEAILAWGFWARRHFLGPSAALVDQDWTLTAAGQRLTDMLLREWRTNLTLTPDATGTIRFRGFHGTYQIGSATIELGPQQTELTVRP